MKTRYIGDCHGRFRQYKRIIDKVDASIQAGDMGVGFYFYDAAREVKASQNPPYDAMSRGDHRFIRGNHDNPAVCRTQKFWIPDATMHRGTFCLGGAVSIDRAYRIQGMSWWEDEELSHGELFDAIGEYERIKPDVVCTHECPEFVANEYLAWSNMAKIEDGGRTRKALENMWAIRPPRFWVFGHWHQTFTMRRGPTTFQCLGELDWCDVEVDGDEIRVELSDGTKYEA